MASGAQVNRKQRRARDRALKKQRSKADFEEKLGLFGMLEDECLSCQKPFDKKNKQMVTTWSVVVREKENKVNLYCPDCWAVAINILKEVGALPNEGQTE